MHINKNALTIFDELYSDVNGFLISLDARKKRDISGKSFTYGEIKIESFAEILSDVNLLPNHIFYDLGTGTGKPVFAASLLKHPKKAIGIELLSELVDEARIVQKKYATLLKKYKYPDEAEVHFIVDDILTYDWSDGDVVYMASTCFEPDMMQKIAQNAEKLKSGSKIITLTKELPSTQYKLIKQKGYEMTWGITTVHIYEKV